MFPISAIHAKLPHVKIWANHTHEIATLTPKTNEQIVIFPASPISPGCSLASSPAGLTFLVVMSLRKRHVSVAEISLDVAEPASEPLLPTLPSYTSVAGAQGSRNWSHTISRGSSSSVAQHECPTEPSRIPQEVAHSYPRLVRVPRGEVTSTEKADVSEEEDETLSSAFQKISDFLEDNIPEHEKHEHFVVEEEYEDSTREKHKNRSRKAEQENVKTSKSEKTTEHKSSSDKKSSSKKSSFSKKSSASSRKGTKFPSGPGGWGKEKAGGLSELFGGEGKEAEDANVNEPASDDGGGSPEEERKKMKRQNTGLKRGEGNNARSSGGHRHNDGAKKLQTANKPKAPEKTKQPVRKAGAKRPATNKPGPSKPGRMPMKSHTSSMGGNSRQTATSTKQPQKMAASAGRGGGMVRSDLS